jgi:hypothetical protein
VFARISERILSCRLLTLVIVYYHENKLTDVFAENMERVKVLKKVINMC